MWSKGGNILFKSMEKVTNINTLERGEKKSNTATLLAIRPYFYNMLFCYYRYETIYHMAPNRIHKVLINVKKTHERNKKKKKEDNTEDDEDSEIEHLKSQPERYV